MNPRGLVLVVVLVLVGCGRRESFVHELIVLEDGTAVVALEDGSREMALARIGVDGDRIWTTPMSETERPSLGSIGDRVFLRSDGRRSQLLEARSLASGDLLWQRDLFDKKDRGTTTIHSARDATEVVISRGVEGEVVFIGRDHGEDIGRYPIRNAGDEIVRIGRHVFAGRSRLHVFEMGARVAERIRARSGCRVGGDYVFAQGDGSRLQLVRLRGGDPARSVVVDLELSSDNLIDACYGYAGHVILAGHAREGTRFWRVDASGKLVGQLEMPGYLRIEETQTAMDRVGLSATRFLPILDVPAGKIILLDLETLSIVARASTDLLTETLRLGTAWYVVALQPSNTRSLTIARIDGDRGVITSAMHVYGESVDPSRVRVGGDALWVFTWGWRTGGPSVVRLEATTLAATYVGGQLAVAPAAAFVELPR